MSRMCFKMVHFFFFFIFFLDNSRQVLLVMANLEFKTVRDGLRNLVGN